MMRLPGFIIIVEIKFATTMGRSSVSGAGQLVIRTWSWARVLHRSAHAARSWGLLGLDPYWFRNFHRQTNGFDPILISSIQVLIPSFVRRQDQWDLPEKNFIRKKLRSRLSQFCTVCTRLQKNYVIYDEFPVP